MTGLFSNPARPQLLTVRCQIWHRSEYRQSYTDNQDLAFILRFCSSHGWRMKATRLENGSYGNDLVPIEVDLQCTYNDLPLASASLREIFLGTAELHVNDLFKNRESEPLYVNMYPIGSVTLDDIRRGFTHFRALQSLAVQSHAYAKRCPNTTQSIEAELCIESLTAGRALSNQDLLDNLVYMQRASTHFSKYQMYIAKLTKLLLQVHGNSSSTTDNMISSLIGAGLAFESKRDRVRKDADLSQFTMIDPIEDESEE